MTNNPTEFEMLLQDLRLNEIATLELEDYYINAKTSLVKDKRNTEQALNSGTYL